MPLNKETKETKPFIAITPKSAKKLELIEIIVDYH